MHWPPSVNSDGLDMLAPSCSRASPAVALDGASFGSVAGQVASKGLRGRLAGLSGALARSACRERGSGQVDSALCLCDHIGHRGAKLGAAAAAANRQSPTDRIDSCKEVTALAAPGVG
jgi:hypothetical protein